MPRLFVFLITAMLVLSMTATAFAETKERIVILKVGDSQALIDNQPAKMDAPAKVVNGSTLVPLRFVGEAFGCDIQWQGETQTVFLSLGDHIIQVPIGKTHALINGDESPLQVPAQLIDGSTYVPLRFVGESLGAGIEWNGEEQKITINMRRYSNEQMKYQFILPSGWVLDEENGADVMFKMSDGSYCNISRDVDQEGEINKNNFEAFAVEWLKEYEGKQIIAEDKGDNGTGVIYKEEGVIKAHFIKLLNHGLYLVVAEFPVQESLAEEYVFVVNTLSDL